MSRPGMAAGAYNTLLRVHRRQPGTAADGSPAGEWFLLAHHWAQLVELGGAETQSGQGQRHTRSVGCRLRWFPGWESVFRQDHRVQIGGAGVLLAITHAGEEPQAAAGTQRTLRLELQGGA